MCGKLNLAMERFNGEPGACPETYLSGRQASRIFAPHFQIVAGDPREVLFLNIPLKRTYQALFLLVDSKAHRDVREVSHVAQPILLRDFKG